MHRAVEWLQSVLGSVEVHVSDADVRWILGTAAAAVVDAADAVDAGGDGKDAVTAGIDAD